MLCQLSRQFPPFVEKFLERSRPLRRRFREETVTDLLMGSLITAGGRRIIVEFPDEPVTGADMEWNFANPNDSTFFRILLQAKQCYGEGKSWTRHGYRELLHSPGRGSSLQATTLCNTARSQPATFPLYIFYHPESTCSFARAKGATLTGACLADGYAIEKLAVNATTRALRTQNKSLKMIAPLLFQLSDLFCPLTISETGPYAFIGDFASLVAFGREGGRPVIGVPMPPTPEVIRQRIVGSRKILTTSGQVSAELPSVPEISNRIPAEVLATIERPAASHLGLRHWRVTFVSASRRDIDADPARINPGSG